MSKSKTISKTTARSVPGGVDDTRWAAVLARDPAADGDFFYGVLSTGVYCRPSCPSRKPRRDNVRFLASRGEAERAGFRPCKRCRPDRPSLDQDHAAKVERACRIIESSETAPTLEELAARVGVSAFHFHRIFRRITGLTPKQYGQARREQRVREALGRGRPVTEAIFDAGYGSNGRFYEKSAAVLGMTPGRYRSGGAGACIRFAVGECSLGSILVAGSERGICAIALGDDPETLVRDLEDRFPRAELIGGDRDFERLVARVVGMVESPGAAVDLPLDVRGTAFQQQVWRALREIPAGSTASYAEIARRIGAPKSARAVARACAANPLAVAIPCHRVVRNDGGLSGYRWGVARKRTLLERETRQ
jgi:AraC family transcriptional regulator of adaptative response/methylated-DNA-[protein]-cysteine methyltransferase